MERETKRDHKPNTKEEEDHHSLKKPLVVLPCGGDKLKRDEWSEGAVSSLIEAYESKWVLRNRAKLKGQDWEDVAQQVSTRSNSTKSPKTQTQCKNKIESMKKRYRLESAMAEPSSWPLFPRLDLLLRCRSNPPLMLLDQQKPPSPSPLPPPPPPPPPSINILQDSFESNGVEKVAKEDYEGTKQFNQRSDKMPMEMDSSTPISTGEEVKLKSKKKMKMEKKKRRKSEEWEVAESVRWLAEVVVRSEQARMDTMRELERMRVEAEAKKGEMDLKRTEIITKTQLQIAKLLAGNDKSVDSSLRIGRN